MAVTLRCSTSYLGGMAGAIVSVIEWTVPATVIESSTFFENDKDADEPKNRGQIYSEIQHDDPTGIRPAPLPWWSNRSMPDMFIQNTVIAAPAEPLWPDVVANVRVRRVSQPVVVGKVRSGGNNLIGVVSSDNVEGWIGSDIFEPLQAFLDPELGPLQDNGGPTNTHAPLPGSPLLDAGSKVGFKGVNTLLTDPPIPVPDPNDPYAIMELYIPDATVFEEDAKPFVDRLLGVLTVVTPFLIRVGDELMLVTAIDEANNQLTVDRGARRTVPVAHAVDATVVQGFEALNTLLETAVNTVDIIVTIPRMIELPTWPTFDIRINDEEMRVTGVQLDLRDPEDPDDDVLDLTVERGANGTTAANHIADSNVLILTDQRGGPRFFGDEIDIGAYEKAAPSVYDRHVFYNNSKWDAHAGFDEGDPAANAFDDAAIATDKTALFPGEPAAFVNYTSYTRGINGIMVDIRLLADPTEVGDGDFSEFTFKVGNDDSPGDWSPAVDPVDVDVREIGGDVHRVTIIWADNAIPNKNWLEVTVKQHVATGLAADDVFYFGNTIGENTGDFRVDYDDVFENIWPRLFTPDPIGVDDVGDINRDTRIDYSDVFDGVWPHLFEEDPLIKLNDPEAPEAPAAPPAAPLESAGLVAKETPPWLIKLMWIEELYRSSRDSKNDDLLRAAAVDGVFSLYYEE